MLCSLSEKPLIIPLDTFTSLFVRSCSELYPYDLSDDYQLLQSQSVPDSGPRTNHDGIAMAGNLALVGLRNEMSLCLATGPRLRVILYAPWSEYYFS